MSSESHSSSILIIGGGFSGAAVAIHLLRRASVPLKIVVVEKRETLAKGVAYGIGYEGHLLNVPAGKMSLYQDRPDHFLNWSRAELRAGRFQFAGGIRADDYLTRKLYGEYLQQELREAEAEAGPGVALVHERDEAIDLQMRPEGGALVLLRSGKVVEGDRVVLALGNLPSRYPIAKPLPVYDSFRYIHFPWAEKSVEEIPADETVLLVGAGLASIDMALQLQSQGHRAVIHALSLRGLQPQNHQSVEPWPLFLQRDNLPRTIRLLLKAVRTEVTKAERKGSDWRAVIDSLRPVTQELWRGFPLEERSRFLRHLRPFWEVHRHRVAPAVAAQIRKLEEEKQLRRWAGRLVRLVEGKGEIEATVRLLGAETALEFRVGWVINCTGSRSDFSKFDHPLLISLLASGLLSHDPLALGFQTDEAGALIPFGKNEGTDWIFALGAPLKGMLWETTAVPEIRVQAERLAARLLA